TWSQPYLMKVFNAEEVAFNKFLDNFKYSFFDPNRQHRAEAYTQEFNSHACTIGWANTPLMSLYQHGLKENFQLTVVMSNIQFNSLQTMQAMALKAGHTIEGIKNGQTSPIPTTQKFTNYSIPSPTLNTRQHHRKVARNLCLQLTQLEDTLAPPNCESCQPLKIPDSEKAEHSQSLSRLQCGKRCKKVLKTHQRRNLSYLLSWFLFPKCM
ncbi:uncharacterized protein VP01_6756g1, partial [Puccinia sorghi]